MVESPVTVCNGVVSLVSGRSWVPIGLTALLAGVGGYQRSKAFRSATLSV